MRTKPILSYAAVFVAFSFVYLLLLHTPLLSGMSVLFYRGSVLLLLVILLFGLLSRNICQILRINTETYLAALVMSASLHLSLFVVFPVTFDRSVTMFLLNKLQSSQSKICQDSSERMMETIFIKEYVKNQQAIRRRITEQKLIDFVNETNSCLILTSRGKQFLQFSEIVKKLYAIY